MAEYVVVRTADEWARIALVSADYWTGMAAVVPARIVDVAVHIVDDYLVSIV